jgi:hypothetical protein
VSSPVVHLAATVQCTHTGRAQPSAPYTRVQLSGQAVITTSSSYAVTGCTMPSPNAGNGPCTTGQWSSGSTRVLAGGQPLVLQNGQSTCVPTGTPLTVVSTQTRVTAV